MDSSTADFPALFEPSSAKQPKSSSNQPEASGSQSACIRYCSSTSAIALGLGRMGPTRAEAMTNTLTHPSADPQFLGSERVTF
jgi:hypothetical protein